MPCEHTFFPLCGCAPDVAPAASAAPIAPAPVADPYKPKRGRPRTPWGAERGVDTSKERSTQAQIQKRDAQIAAEAPSQVARVLEMAAVAPAEFTRQFEIAIAFGNFARFCRLAWNTIEPATKLQWNWHHELIANTLQALFEDWKKATDDETYVNAVRNAAISVCPGSLKSRITSVMFPVWCWLHRPGMKFICLSVNEDAAMRDARAARELIKSDWFQESYHPKWTLKGDQDAVSNYGNTESGERLSKPSGSKIIGLRADIILYDDPNDPHEAENTDEREKLNKLWQDNIYNRVNDPDRSLRIGIQQRVHTNDWTGYVLATQGKWSATNPNGWLNVVLPAEFDPDRKFVMPEQLVSSLREIFGTDAQIIVEDQRIVEGVSVHPERFSKEFLDGERKRWEGTANFDGQMNQAPVGKKGGQIQRAWFNFCRLEGGVRPNVDALGGGRPRPAECHKGDAYLVEAAIHRPGQWKFDWLEISVDAALHKTDRGSNWGLGVMAGQGGRRFVLDDRTQRGDILEIIEILRDMIKTWHPDKILIEKKAAGDNLRVMMQAEMAKGDMPPVQIEVVDPGTQGKEQRLDPCKPALSAGMLHLLDEASWLDKFVAELAGFPFFGTDDRVDYVTQCMNYHAPSDAESNQLPDW